FDVDGVLTDGTIWLFPAPGGMQLHAKDFARHHADEGGFGIVSQSTVEAKGFHAHEDRKSTRLNSSHLVISYAVFCLKKKSSYAVTASAGGYSVPVPASGNYTVTFSGGSVPTNQKSVSVINGQNVKSDYIVTGSGTPTPTPGSTRLANISTRAVVGTNANVLIGGFIITGTQTKKVIARGIGPS